MTPNHHLHPILEWPSTAVPPIFQADVRSLEHLVVTLTVLIVPAIVGLVGALLARKKPGQVSWAGYVLSALAIAALVLISPAAWLALLPTQTSNTRIILINMNLILAPWIGAVLTALVGIVSGTIGAIRHRDASLATK
ncbi:MAG TPA: hypothetical protein VGP24_04975 [Glaciihabitans sp.]|jgi:hypothetical protein|nr:hypothetical protein [Glaciihabitans sp.]